MSYCTSCGAGTQSNAMFCTACGASLAVSQSVESQEPTLAGISHPQLPRRRMVGIIVRAGAVGLTKSLALSALLMAPGFVLLSSGLVLPGIAWLFVSSFGLMAWRYRKPWRLMWVTCLAPPIASAACYWAQLYYFKDVLPPTPLLLAVAGVGGFLGLLRGAAHKIRVENGSLMAKRTVGYLLVWAIAYIGTQTLGMIGGSVLLIRGGLLTGALTTAMLATVACILLWKRSSALRMAAAAAVALGIAAGSLNYATHGGFPVAVAQNKWELADRERFSDTLEKIADGGIAWVAEHGDSAGIMKSFAMDNMIWPLDGNRFHAEFSGRMDEDDAIHTIKLHIYQYKTATGAQTEVRFRIDEAEELASLSSQNSQWRYIGRNPIPDGSRDATMLVTERNRSSDWVRHHSVIMSRGSWGLFIEPTTISMHGLEDFIASWGAGFDAAGIAESAVSIQDRATGWIPNLGGLRSKAQEVLDNDTQFTPDEQAAKQIAAIAIMILIGAGISASSAQAIAGAIAQAFQAAAEAGSDEVGDALNEMLHGNKKSIKARAVIPPPIIDPTDDQQFEQNKKGEYFAPDDKGKWRWLNREDTLEAAQALRNEMRQREAEVRHHNRETGRMLDESRRQMHSNAAADDQRARLSNQRRERLHDLIEKTIAESDTSEERRAALEGQLASLVHDHDKEGAEILWSELRGTRQSQVDAWAAEAGGYAADGERLWWYEAGATFVRDGSKIALGAATAQATAAWGLGSAVLYGGALQGAVQATEEGIQVGKDGVSVDVSGTKALQGFARGYKNGTNAAIGGVSTAGSLRTAVAKIVAQSGLDAGDVYSTTGDFEKAKTAMKVGLVKNFVGEGIDHSGRSDFIRKAMNHANNVAGSAYEGVHIHGKDITSASRDALAAEATNAFWQQAGSSMASQASDSPANQFMDSSTPAKAGDNDNSSGDAPPMAPRKQPGISEDADQPAFAPNRPFDSVADDTKVPLPHSARGDDTSHVPAGRGNEENRTLSPHDRVAQAEAEHRLAQSKLWKAQKQLEAAQQNAEQNPDDTAARMNAREAEQRASQAESNEMKTALDARDAYESVRGTDVDSQNATGPTHEQPYSNIEQDIPETLSRQQGVDTESAENRQSITGDAETPNQKRAPSGDDLEILDSNDPHTIPSYTEGENVSEQGRGISAEEASRKWISIRADGKPDLSASNPHDHIGPNESILSVNPYSGEIEVIHGTQVEPRFKEGIKNRLLAKAKGGRWVEKAVDDFHARESRIENQELASNRMTFEAEARGSSDGSLPGHNSEDQAEGPIATFRDLDRRDSPVGPDGLPSRAPVPNAPHAPTPDDATPFVRGSGNQEPDDSEQARAWHQQAKNRRDEEIKKIVSELPPPDSAPVYSEPGEPMRASTWLNDKLLENAPERGSSHRDLATTNAQTEATARARAAAAKKLGVPEDEIESLHGAHLVPYAWGGGNQHIAGIPDTLNTSHLGSLESWAASKTSEGQVHFEAQVVMDPDYPDLPKEIRHTVTVVKPNGEVEVRESVQEISDSMWLKPDPSINRDAVGATKGGALKSVRRMGGMLEPRDGGAAQPVKPREHWEGIRRTRTN